MYRNMAYNALFIILSDELASLVLCEKLSSCFSLLHHPSRHRHPLFPAFLSCSPAVKDGGRVGGFPQQHRVGLNWEVGPASSVTSQVELRLYLFSSLYSAFTFLTVILCTLCRLPYIVRPDYKYHLGNHLVKGPAKGLELGNNQRKTSVYFPPF